MKILIIEDNSLTLNSLKQMAEGLGHEAFLAENAGAAQKYLSGETFDLLLCDVMMPGVSGLSFVSFLRNTAQCPTPIVMMSTLSNESLLKAAFDAGANDFIVKPFTAMEFAKKLEKFKTAEKVLTKE
jgi:two-component system, OmpR family, response regulator